MRQRWTVLAWSEVFPALTRRAHSWVYGRRCALFCECVYRCTLVYVLYVRVSVADCVTVQETCVYCACALVFDLSIVFSISGGGPDWDYCYDPSGTLLLVVGCREHHLSHTLCFVELLCFSQTQCCSFEIIACATPTRHHSTQLLCS